MKIAVFGRDMRRLLTLPAIHTSQPNKRLQKQPKVKPDDSKMEVADGCFVVTLVYVFSLLLV